MDQVLTKSMNVPAKVTAGLPRVLYVVAMDPSQKFGSLEEQIVFLAQVFQDEGSLFLPLFICPDPQVRPTPIEKAGVSIACLNMRRFSWGTLSQLLSLVTREKIDIVHWNFSPPLTNSYLWWLTLLQPGVKHYLTDHNSRILPLSSPVRGLKRWCKRMLLKRYAKTLCISQFVLDCLKAQNAWSNLDCCRYFINTARFQPDSRARAKIRADQHIDRQFVLLTVAHLIKEKGVDVVLRALTLLPDEVVLWVIGSGPEAENLCGLSRDLGLSQRVVFHGPQWHVEPFMQGADCFVCPSLWAEAVGLVNLEAQASGLPVIASNVGGIPEYVADGRTGFLFPPNNAVELADRVRRLLDDPALRQRFSRAARVLAEEQFSPAARVPEIVALYRS
jgi:glycosyltransferase involved in cell wall biosynthesis